MYSKADFVKKHIRKIVGHSSPGDRILPEIKLAKKLKVSHSTVRRALDELVDEGLLVRQHGSGTFVNEISQYKNKSVVSLTNFFQADQQPATNKKELRFATYESAKEIALYHNLIDDFEQLNKNFHFKLESRPLKTFPDYFHDIENGNAPDVFYLNQSHLFWLIRNSHIKPLEDYIDKTCLSNLDCFIKRAITFKGKTWLIPKNHHVFYLVYNKQLFDQCGLAYPTTNWTWLDYLEAAKELTKTNSSNPTKSVFGAIPHRDYLYLTPLIWAYGGEFVDNNGTVKINSPECIEAIKFAVDLTLKHKVTDSPEQWDFWNMPSLKKRNERPFSTGNLAMYLKTGTDISNYLNSDIDFGITSIPLGPAGRFSPLLFSGWAVANTTPQPETCGKLLTHLGIDSAPVFARNNLSPFVTEETLQSYFTPDKPGHGYSILMMKNHLRDYSFHGHYWPYLMGHIDKMLESIFHQKSSVKDTVSVAQKRMQTAMNNFLRWYKE